MSQGHKYQDHLIATLIETLHYFSPRKHELAYELHSCNNYFILTLNFQRTEHIMYKLSASNEDSVNEAKFSLFIINTIALCWQRHYLARQAEQFFNAASHGATVYSICGYHLFKRRRPIPADLIFLRRLAGEYISHLCCVNEEVVCQAAPPRSLLWCSR